MTADLEHLIDHVRAQGSDPEAAHGDGGFLYSVPGAERAYDDPVACYEAQIDGIPPRGETTIERWTATGSSASLPTPEHMAEWVAEHSSDETVFEDEAEQWAAAAKEPDVLAAFKTAGELMARKVTWRRCDTLDGKHTVTWSETGEPLLDGEPMYVKREGAAS